MLIDVEGRNLTAWVRGNGPIITDTENPYHIEFAIAVQYNEEQKRMFHEVCECKRYLNSTDYQAIKYSEGAITEEEFAPIREARSKAREHIRELGNFEPTLTKEQIAEAERKAMQKGER